MSYRSRASSIAAWSLVAFAAASLAPAAARAQSQPRDLEPLPDIPPPPRLSTSPVPDDLEAPTVTIREQEGTKIEEFRSKDGRVYAVRVTPKIGKPYMLLNPDDKGEMTKPDLSGTGVRPALWTIFEW